MEENSRIVRIETPAANKLGEMMNAIRSWLDSQKIQPTTFKVIPNGLELAFHHDHEAAHFREQFGGQPA
jgi:hypothetical protein